jgi:hypothetical protein
MRYSYLSALALAAIVAACNDGVTSPDDSGLHLTGGGERLSLTATQTAEGLWERRVEYDWTAQRYPKEIHVGPDMRLLPESDRVEILPGQIVWVTFQVDAHRRVASDATVKGVRGETCVTNTSRSAVGGFVVVEQVMANVNGHLKPVDGATAVVHVDEKLEAGTARCLDYEILFDAQPGVAYRVVAVVAAHVGGRAAVQAAADFLLSSEQRTVEIDAEAWMRDGAYAGCAKTLSPDFTCTSIDGIPRDQRIAPPTATGHLGMSFMVDIKNDGVCGQTFVYTIDEPLREGGPNPPGGEIREVSGSLVITTGDCPPPGGSICVLSEATWRAKYGDGSDAAVAAEFYGIFLGDAHGEKAFYITGRDMVLLVFARVGVTNPIGELYAQLYAAKLNIASGADPRPVREVRIAADAFLGTHRAGDWDSLTEAQQKAIVEWVRVLTAYNEGRLGPAMCGTPPPPPAPPGDGCTRTIGYWKNHAGFGPQPDVVTPLLPIWLGTAAGAKSVFVTSAAQAVELLNMSGDASNGINKLYAQLLAARLNIKNGANGSAVLQTITQADVFLSTHAAADWGSLSAAERQRVLTWMSTLDDYNNGRLGPSQCH